MSTKLAAGPPGSTSDRMLYVVSAGLPPVAGDVPAQPRTIGGSVGVAVGVGPALVGAVSAANTVKCDVLPVMLLAVGLTVDPPSAGCQVDVVGSKKNTPAGGEPLKVSVTAAGGLKPETGAPVAASVAVRLTTVLTTCCPLSVAGGAVRVSTTVVFCATAPGGKLTWALPSGSPTEPPPGPMTA